MGLGEYHLAVKRPSSALRMLLPLLLLAGCYSPRDDLDQLCLVTDVVIADHIPEEHVMREIATRYKPRNGTVEKAWK